MGKVPLEKQLLKGLPLVRLDALPHQAFPDGPLLRGVAHGARQGQQLPGLQVHGPLKGWAVQGCRQHHGPQPQGQGVKAGQLEAVAVGQLKMGLALHLCRQIFLRPHDHRAAQPVLPGLQQAKADRDLKGILQGLEGLLQAAPVLLRKGSAVKAPNAFPLPHPLLHRSLHGYFLPVPVFFCKLIIASAGAPCQAPGALRPRTGDPEGRSGLFPTQGRTFPDPS